MLSAIRATAARDGLADLDRVAFLFYEVADKDQALVGDLANNLATPALSGGWQNAFPR